MSAPKLAVLAPPGGEHSPLGRPGGRVNVFRPGGHPHRIEALSDNP